MSNIHVAAVDLGTQSIRASVFALDGERLVHRRRPIESRGRGEAREQDPTSWTSFLEDEFGSFLRDPDLDVRAIGVAGTSNGCVPIDAQGRALAFALTHYDHRAEREAALIRRAPSYPALSEKHALETTAGSALAKVLWLRRNRPEIYDRTELFLDPTAFLFHALTGVGTMDYFNAQRFFYDVTTASFEPALFEEIGIDRRKIPRRGNRRCFFTAPARSRIAGLALGSAVSVTNASFDNQCAMSGAGVVDPGTVHENSGSGLSLRAFADRPVAARGISCVPVPDPELPGRRNHHVISSYLRATGLWLRSWLESKHATHEDFSTAVAAGFSAESPPGILCYPIAESGGMAFFDPEGRRIRDDLSAESLSLSPESCRSIFGGMVFESRVILEAFERSLGTQSLVCSGGFANSPALSTVKASLLGRTIAVSEDPEATSRGAAVIAAFGAGLFPSLRQAAAAMSCGKRTIHAERSSECGYRRYLRFREPVLAAAGRPSDDGP